MGLMLCGEMSDVQRRDEFPDWGYRALVFATGLGVLVYGEVRPMSGGGWIVGAAVLVAALGLTEVGLRLRSGRLGTHRLRARLRLVLDIWVIVVAVVTLAWYAAGIPSGRSFEFGAVLRLIGWLWIFGSTVRSGQLVPLVRRVFARSA